MGLWRFLREISKLSSYIPTWELLTLVAFGAVARHRDVPLGRLR